MRTMFAAVILSTGYLQGCTTMPDITKMTEASEKVEVAAEAESEQLTSYVGSAGNRVLLGSGDCLRSGGLSSENLVVECQASSNVAVSEKAPAPAPQQLARLSFDGTALFAFDSAELSSQGRSELSSLVSKLNGNADIGSIYVVGHADSTGAKDYNMGLSESRAATVRQFLESSLNNVQVMASGLGESAPVADNSTSAGRQQNRRVEVKIDAVDSKSVFE